MFQEGVVETAISVWSPRTMDEFVETGSVTTTATTIAIENEREVTKTFQIPESLGCRLKVRAAQTGQKEKDILVDLISNYLNEHETGA